MTVGEGVMAEEFRLPGSTYEELVNIIIAYGTRDEASNPGDVGKLNSAHQTSVSRNNAFLVGIGVLKGEHEKLVTKRGRALAMALARKDREGIRQNWREVVSTSEFLQNVVSAVKLREGMLYPTVQAYIAHAAGQPRNNPVMNGAGALISILKAAGLLKEEAGELVATFDEDLDQDSLVEDAGEPAGVADATPNGDAPKPVEASVVAEAKPGNGDGPVINVHLHVRCTPEEIEDLAPKLKALLKELSGDK
jgi:hypothetical protein